MKRAPSRTPKLEPRTESRWKQLLRCVAQLPRWAQVASALIALLTLGGNTVLFQRAVAQWRAWNVSYRSALMGFETHWMDGSAGEVAAVFEQYRTAMADAQEQRWDLARAKLQALEDRKLRLPGVRSNLGAIELELGRNVDAKRHLEAELELLEWLRRRAPKELIAHPLFDPVGSPNMTAEGHLNAITRAVAVTEYNLACLAGASADHLQTSLHLRKAIQGGFSRAGDLEQMESDRFLSAFRKTPEYEPLVAPLRVSSAH